MEDEMTDFPTNSSTPERCASPTAPLDPKSSLDILSPILRSLFKVSLQQLLKGLLFSEYGSQFQYQTSQPGISESTFQIVSSCLAQFTGLPPLLSAQLYRAFLSPHSSSLNQLDFVSGLQNLLQSTGQQNIELVFRLLQLPNPQRSPDTICLSETKTLLYEVARHEGFPILGFITNSTSKYNFQKNLHLALDSLFREGQALPNSDRAIGLDRFRFFSIFLEGDLPRLLLTAIFRNSRISQILDHVKQNITPTSHSLSATKWENLVEACGSSISATRGLAKPRHLRNFALLQESEECLDLRRSTQQPISLFEELGISKSEIKRLGSALSRNTDSSLCLESYVSSEKCERSEDAIQHCGLQGQQVKLVFSRKAQKFPSAIIPINSTISLRESYPGIVSAKSDKPFWGCELVFPSGKAVPLLFNEESQYTEWLEILGRLIPELTLEERFNRKGIISTNRHGTVYEAETRDGAKQAKITSILKSALTEEQLKNLRERMLNLKLASHACLGSGYSIEQDFEAYYIVEELSEAIDLATYLRNLQSAPIQEHLVMSILLQLAELLAYGKAVGLVFRSISLESLLVTTEDDDSVSVQLSDLSLLSSAFPSEESSFKEDMISAGEVLGALVRHMEREEETLRVTVQSKKWMKVEMRREDLSSRICLESLLKIVRLL